MIHCTSVSNLDKFKLSLLHKEASEIENNFVGCYATWWKDGIYAVTNSIQIFKHIKTFIPVKSSFFLNRIQQSGFKETKQSKVF